MLKNKINASPRFLHPHFRAFLFWVLPDTSVLNWIRTMGDSVKIYAQTDMPRDTLYVDFDDTDEMWHFTVKKNENWV